MFNIKWNLNEGEAKLKLSKQWGELNYIQKLDGMHDALHDITELYNNTLAERHKSNKVAKVRRVK